MKQDVIGLQQVVMNVLHARIDFKENPLTGDPQGVEKVKKRQSKMIHRHALDTYMTKMWSYSLGHFLGHF